MSPIPAAVIGGEAKFGSGPIASLLDPAEESPIAEVASADERLAADAVEAAAAAWRSGWRRSTPRDRARVLEQLAEHLASHRDAFAAVESRNVGFPIGFAEGEVDAAIDALRFFAGAGRTVAGIPSGEYVQGMTSLMRWEPLGVVAAFVPWNTPLLMAVWKIAPAIAAGNTVVLRPSRRTPISALDLARAVADLDLAPPGVINVVVGDHDSVGRTLVEHPDVALVALTGSAAAGRHLAASAAAGPKPLHLELGGKTPIIVCADADVRRAASKIARAALDNAGQDCTAATRVLAVEPVATALTDRLAEALTSLRIGPPAARATELGPLIGQDRRAAVLAHVERAVSAGATEVVRAAPVGTRGWFLSPGLLTDLAPDASILEAEVFGPVVTVERCTDETDAVRRANASRYALAAGIWTSRIDRALGIAAALDAGKIWVNEHHRDVTEMPHGGTKESGFGSDLSVLALQHYSRPKAVHLAIAEETQ